MSSAESGCLKRTDLVQSTSEISAKPATSSERRLQIFLESHRQYWERMRTGQRMCRQALFSLTWTEAVLPSPLRVHSLSLLICSAARLLLTGGSPQPSRSIISTIPLIDVAVQVCASCGVRRQARGVLIPAFMAKCLVDPRGTVHDVTFGSRTSYFVLQIESCRRKVVQSDRRQRKEN